MGFGSILKNVGLGAAGLFTGGATWPLLLGSAAAGIGTSLIAKKIAGGGGGDDKNKSQFNPNAVDQYLPGLQKKSDEASQHGHDLSGQGSGAMEPVLQYYRDLLSPNGSALMAATAPERGRVIDQYDTARKSAAAFGPRGGGTTGALAQSRFDQAESIGDITSQARTSGVAGAGELGLQLQSLGLSAEQLASQDLDSVIRAVLGRGQLELGQQQLDVERRGQNMGMWSGIGQAAGLLAGLYLTRPGGVWGEKPINVGQGGTGI